MDVVVQEVPHDLRMGGCCGMNKRRVDTILHKAIQGVRGLRHAVLFGYLGQRFPVTGAQHELNAATRAEYGKVGLPTNIADADYTYFHRQFIPRGGGTSGDVKIGIKYLSAEGFV